MSSSIVVVEFSAEREVRALGWAMKMIRARNVHDDGEAFHAVETAYYGDLKTRGESEEMRALWFAFTRIASTLALEAGLEGEGREDVLRRTYNSLAKCSLEHDPDDPWGWLDALDEDEGAENAKEQLRYLRDEDEEPA